MGRKNRDSFVGVCQLCLQQARLVDSHILPKFVYKPLKGAENRYHVLSTSVKDHDAVGQKGLTEYLCCAKCDNERLQKNETKFAELLANHWPSGTFRRKQIINLQVAEHARCKKALLSMLWRMSISSLDFFSAVSLGKRHEEELRLLLLNDDTIDDHRYAITGTLPLIDGVYYRDAIMQPDSTRLGKNRLYRCVIAGTLFGFDVSSAEPDAILHDLIFSATKWPLLCADVREIPFLNDAYSRLSYASGLRLDLSGSP